MAWCIKSIVPVLWSDLVLESGSKEERMMQEAAAFGLRDGLMSADGPNLTVRERESLSWAADGKASNEIAQLLGISESTVNFDLHNAMRKLNVATRQQGIAKAALHRLIQPKPF